MKTKTKELSRGEIVSNYFSERSTYWDSLYKDPDGSERFLKHELKRRKEIVFDAIANRNPAAIHSALDLGCGAGQYTRELAHMGFNCTGADISEKMLQLAREKQPPSPTMKWIQSDCRDVPAEDHSFDLILCIGVLEYLDDDRIALQEIRRLIKPTGQVMVSLPNLYKLRNVLNPYYYLIRIWTYLFKPRSTSTGKKLEYCKSTTRRYNRLQLRRIFKQTGFCIQEVKSCSFGTFSLWKKEILPVGISIKISNVLERLSNGRSLRFLTCFANRWVVILQPKTTDPNSSV